MADRGDTHYSTSTLNKWFAFSSAFLFVSTVWLMLDDWTRQWKDYQREFRELEISKAEEERAAVETAEALADEQRLAEAVAAAEADLESKSEALADAKAVFTQADADFWIANERAKKAKAEYDWIRYQTEEHRLAAGEPEYNADGLAAAADEMNATAKVKETTEIAMMEAQAVIDELKAGVERARTELAAETRELERVRGRVETLDPSDAPTQIANILRDAPGLDFVGPNLQVKKRVLGNLTNELNFTKKTRIDMCETCHLGVERSNFADAEQPFTAHPRLDLYLSANSPHPVSDVGCTICHRGGGEALHFVRSDHRPDSEEQAEEWREEYHWHKQHHWDYPMLAKSYTEASCVQCHKDSMELIAEDAPTVTEGYRNFERFGCYACHKVDWFPEQRKPGPTLENIQAKVDMDWFQSWVAAPKDFRPTTWMPQIFHLENFAPDEIVTISKYGEGEEITGQEWNDTAIAAISAFIAERAPKKDLPAIPVEGDAWRGREEFRLIGCLSCHNMAPFGDEETATSDLAFEVTETNGHGPNLRGIATKVNAEWLYNWIKDPHSLWEETRMPNLRLDDQQAADITAYIMEDPDGIFTDVPDGWEAVASPTDDETLKEMARWFFSRDGRGVVESRLEGNDAAFPWDDQATLSVAVGEKLVAHHGCFSCHSIAGMGDMMPIGTELSNWGSKTVDKLDFGFVHEILAEQHGWNHDQVHEFKAYKEPWLEQKLHAPRSYDLQKVKNPVERLRMPYFGFTDDEVQSIATFVVGLVNDEVQQAKMIPTPEQAALDMGLRTIRQKNCMSCHMVDPGTVTFLDEDDHERTVHAQILPVDQDEIPYPPAHTLASLDQQLEDIDTEEFGVQLLAPAPWLGDEGEVGTKLFLERDQLVSLGAPNGGDFVRLVTDYYYNGIELYDEESEDPDDAYYYVTGDPDDEFRVQDTDGEWREYYGESYDKIRWTFAPPVLWNEGFKVQRDWFFDFLNDVRPLRHQIRTRMPSFRWREGEAESVADAFAVKARREWAANFVLKLRLQTGLSVDELAEAANIQSAHVADLESGSLRVPETSVEALVAFAARADSRLPGPPSTGHERIERRGTAYLADREQEVPDHLEKGRSMAEDKVNCYTCHFRLGVAPAAEPIAWAPDLFEAKDRLREDWTRLWIHNPGTIYPGTSMPQNFADNAADYHDVYPDSTNDEQIEAVLDWLYNFDRANL